MKSIGIRELRQNASVYLRLVKAGETIEVTDRGEPVAQLVPIPRNETTLERLVREGKVRPALAPLDLSKLEPVKIRLAPGELTLSEQIIAAREDERY